MPLYFAYGSNMDSAQMARRVPQARAVGRARLVGYRFACDKVGRDGSAKANVAPDAGREVWGVVFELVVTDLAVLDRYEGGYRRRTVHVDATSGSPLLCEIYVSSITSPTLLPTAAYRDRMVRGAREHGLPPAWQRLLAELPVAD